MVRFFDRTAQFWAIFFHPHTHRYSGGKKQGMQVALGIFLSEMFVALLCFFGLSRYFTTPTFQLVFTGMAAATILYLGIQSILTKHHKAQRSK